MPALADAPPSPADDAVGQPVTAWMLADPAVVDEGMRASDVAAHIDAIGRRHVFAVDGEGRLVGLINRSRLLRHLVARRLSGGLVDDVPIGELLVRSLVTIGPEATAREAVCAMRHHHVGCLPVVDAEGHLVGLVSERTLGPVLDTVVAAASGVAGLPSGAPPSAPVLSDAPPVDPSDSPSDDPSVDAAGHPAASGSLAAGGSA